MQFHKCALCGKDDSQIIYKANFDIKKIDEKTFSARRLPDRVHYRIVKCQNCGLIYSNPILPIDKIEKLYKRSYTDYNQQLDNLKKTYGHYLRHTELYGVKKNKLLEIGCGNGFFLLEAKKQGYKQVYGVEPGKKSVDLADREIKQNIVIDILKPGIFKKNFFDVICCFQTLDHIADPNGLLKECYKILKKDGIILFYNHDVGALSNKLLGERSPIIDIEHTHLYDKKTMQKMFEKHGFTVLKVESAFNIHYLGYWIRMFPMPNIIKLRLLKILKKTNIYQKKIKIKAGNLVLFGKK